MIKVLHLNDRLSARGGADRHLVAVLSGLQGRAQTLLAVGYDDGSLPPGEREGLGPWQRVKGLERGGLSARGGEAARRRLSEVLDEFQPDLIHLHNLMDPELLELAVARGRTLMTVQDHRLFCPGLGKLLPEGGICQRPMGEHCLACFGDQEYGRRLLELTQRRLEALKGMARVLLLSHYMASELKALGLAADRLQVIPPFVQGLAEKGDPGPGKYHLLAGRLVARKGVEVALQALDILQEPLPLLVAGDGSLAEAVARRAAGSEGRLSFVGWADRARMGRLLAGAASLWLPSLWAEPFGIVGVEALALGTPVLASSVGGVADWLADGHSGHLLPPGDAKALAAAADRLAQDPERARAMGAAGRAWVSKNLDPERLMDRLMALYQDTIAGGAA